MFWKRYDWFIRQIQFWSTWAKFNCRYLSQEQRFLCKIWNKSRERKNSLGKSYIINKNNAKFMLPSVASVIYRSITIWWKFATAIYCWRASFHHGRILGTSGASVFDWAVQDWAGAGFPTIHHTDPRCINKYQLQWWVGGNLAWMLRVTCYGLENHPC